MANLQPLKDILKNIVNFEVLNDRINDLVGPLRLDSRSIKDGDTFIAMAGIEVAGFKNDGRAYIPMAISQGAQMIFAEENESSEFKSIFNELAKDKIIWIANLR